MPTYIVQLKEQSSKEIADINGFASWIDMYRRADFGLPAPQQTT
jgi:hypothetical protein